ncbi:hypothetical protein [Azonexus sp.]|uniref:hypothetical protein n=1 Tax=Azonexus sp. TaxID=1872668 RepID=UPI0027BA1651|nr:hypothetical protein [Azonexus sp.]
MPSPILARADALMQRRHLSGNDPEEVPVLTDAIDIDDDIPLLVDMEIADAAMPQESIAPANQTPPPSAELSEQLLNELARRVEQRLQAEIPQIIASTVRELLAERENPARLPPD